jgi:hypothetical protein
VAHPLALEPERTVVTLDDVAQVSASVSPPNVIGSVSQPTTVSVLIAGPDHTRSSWARAPTRPGAA